MSGVSENCACLEADCHYCGDADAAWTQDRDGRLVRDLRPQNFEWDDVRVRVEWETDEDTTPAIYQYRDGRDGYAKASCPRCGEAWLHTRRTNAAGVDFIAFLVQEVKVERNQLVCGLCHQVIA